MGKSRNSEEARRWARGAIHEASDADATLRAMERMVQALLERWPFSTEVFAPNGDCLGVNRAWERLWQMPRSIVERYNMLRDPNIRSKHVWPFIQKGFSGENVATPEALYDPGEDNRPGRPRWTDGLIHPVVTELADVSQVVLILHDLTQTKALQSELAALRSQIEELEARKTGVQERLDELTGDAPLMMMLDGCAPAGERGGTLSSRETQVMLGIAAGKSAKEIAWGWGWA